MIRVRGRNKKCDLIGAEGRTMERLSPEEIRRIERKEEKQRFVFTYTISIVSLVISIVALLFG